MDALLDWLGQDNHMMSAIAYGLLYVCIMLMIAAFVFNINRKPFRSWLRATLAVLGTIFWPVAAVVLVVVVIGIAAGWVLFGEMEIHKLPQNIRRRLAVSAR